MILKNIQYKFHQELDAIYNKEEVDQFFFMLITSYYKVSRLDLAMEPSLEVENHDVILKALEALKKEQPIQYVLGETEFYGLPFKINKNTLIPRPETEELVDWIINSEQHKNDGKQLKILDIGTGSGCIAISLAKSLTKAKVYAVDVCKEALKVVKDNEALNTVDILCLEVDILKPETWHSDFKDLKFDIVVSNPPYVRQQEKQLMKPNVLNNEPHLALFVENDNPLRFYKAITTYANTALNKNGSLFFEINEYLGNDMIRLLSMNGFKDIELKQDIFKKDRMIKGIKNNG